MKSIIFLILLFLFNNFYLTQAQSCSKKKFKIVFVADVRVASNKDWLSRVATNWGATGVCLRVFWGHLDTNALAGVDNWTNLDKAIYTISSSEFDNKKLDIYIRICMGLQKPIWVTPENVLSKNDFQITFNDSLYDHQSYEKGIPESERYPLNFVSPNSIEKMENFLKEVLEHVNKTFADSIKIRIKEVVPTFSVSDEEEYPFAAMCGYSSYEIDAFRNYLMNKYYNNLFNLNKKWNPDSTWKDFNSWSEITPGNYNWHLYVDSLYSYPKGRVDWINFRTEQLSAFIGSLAEITSSFGFQMGVQIGSIYDDLIERRGWVDPIKLFEKANSIHVADIYQYSENFDFAAEYLHSICKFWTVTNNMICEPIRFSTETNWPDFDNKEPSFLSQKWGEQLISYYNKGASECYVVGWDITTGKLDSCKFLYEAWRNILLEYSNKKVVKAINQYAVHLSTEQVLYNHNTKSLENRRFELYNSIINQVPYVSTSGNYNSSKDIITNYMIEKNPTYLNNYLGVYFTQSSEYITDAAYLGLIKDSVKTAYLNTTLNSNNGNEEYELIQELKNEYNEIRSALDLIKRSTKYFYDGIK